MIRSWLNIPSEEQQALIEEAKRLANKMSWREIGRRLGVSPTVLKYHADPAYTARYLEQRRFQRRVAPPETINIRQYLGKASYCPPVADISARKAEIPEDRRSLTGFMFGDPLPGRSALDHKTICRRL